MKKLFPMMVFLISMCFTAPSISKDSYFFGGLKIFNYGLEPEDLQTINTSLVSLGFSSSTTETDNSGVGFDVGVGINLSENLAFEGGFVDYGTLEITTTTTGPSETIKTEASGTGFTGALVGKFCEEGYCGYLKGGMHSWDWNVKVSTSLGTSSDGLGTGTDPFFGIGFRSQEDTGFYGSYDIYYLDGDDISSFSFGYSWKF